MGEETKTNANHHLRGCMRGLNEEHNSYPIRAYRRCINRLWCLFSVATPWVYHRWDIANRICYDNRRTFQEGGWK